MAIALGQNTELALAEETTYGTASAGTKQYFDATGESVVIENPNITSTRLRGGRLPTASALVKGGRKRTQGNVDLEIEAQSIGWFLKHLMGSVVNTGAMAPYTHVFTLGNLPIGLTLFVKRDIDTFVYTGTRINTMNFTVNDTMVKSVVGILGQDAALAGTFGTPSYPANNDFFAFYETCLTVDTVATTVRDVSVDFNNNLTEMPQLCSRLNRQPLQGRAAITGQIVKDYEDSTAYTKFVNGTQASLDITITGTGSTAPTLTFHFGAIFYTGGTPVVANDGPIQQTLPFEVRDDGSANGGITVTLVNSTAVY